MLSVGVLVPFQTEQLRQGAVTLLQIQLHNVHPRPFLCGMVTQISTGGDQRPFLFVVRDSSAGTAVKTLEVGINRRAGLDLDK